MQIHRPPGVTDVQMRQAMACPSGCKHFMVQSLAPQEPAYGPRPVWSRCLMCLTWWETNAAGEITALRKGVEFVLCPKCGDHMTTPQTEPGRACPNPGHKVAKLVQE